MSDGHSGDEAHSLLRRQVGWGGGSSGTLPHSSNFSHHGNSNSNSGSSVFAAPQRLLCQTVPSFSLLLIVALLMSIPLMAVCSLLTYRAGVADGGRAAEVHCSGHGHASNAGAGAGAGAGAVAAVALPVPAPAHPAGPPPSSMDLSPVLAGAESAQSVPVVDFFVRTWRGDGHWLVYMLRSIHRFVPRAMYRNIIIAFTRNETAFFESYVKHFSPTLPIILHPQDDPVILIPGPNKGGYYAQIISKLYTYTNSDAAYFIHMDSDTIFNRPVSLVDFIDEQRRVYVTFSAYADMPENFRVWQGSAQQMLREPVPQETMTGHPFVYPREVYPLTIAAVEKAHGMPFLDALNNCTVFNEFTPLGHILTTRMPGRWVEKKTGRSDMIYQSWSWGGFSPEIVAFYECVLQANSRDECTQFKPPESG